MRSLSETGSRVKREQPDMEVASGTTRSSRIQKHIAIDVAAIRVVLSRAPPSYIV